MPTPVPPTTKRRSTVNLTGHEDRLSPHNNLALLQEAIGLLSHLTGSCVEYDGRALRLGLYHLMAGLFALPAQFRIRR